MTKVLVVDDDTNLANSISDIFDVMGYDVQTAYDGLRGWEQVQSEAPDIIVSDIEMPGMNGYEFLQAVRNNQVTETIPFVFLTARSEREHLRQGMVLGADDFVSKPFSAKELVASVEAILNKHQRIHAKHEKTITSLRKNITYALPHELRTPLQSILGFAELMNMDSAHISPEDIDMMSALILKAGYRLQRTVENTLAYAQIEMILNNPEKLRLLRNHILPDTACVIEDSIAMVAKKWKRETNISVKLENQVLRISEENFTRIIEELVDNAFKFSDPDTPIEIRAFNNNGKYKILVRDNGRGMTSEQIKQVGAYIQFDRMLHEQQGSGLGLTIAKRLVELHNGTFFIRSLPNEGTLITVQFDV
jgi:two-component system, sensor histidine kinase and response regulator